MAVYISTVFVFGLMASSKQCQDLYQFMDRLEADVGEFSDGVAMVAEVFNNTSTCTTCPMNSTIAQILLKVLSIFGFSNNLTVKREEEDTEYGALYGSSVYRIHEFQTVCIENIIEEAFNVSCVDIYEPNTIRIAFDEDPNVVCKWFGQAPFRVNIQRDNKRKRQIELETNISKAERELTKLRTEL